MKYLIVLIFAACSSPVTRDYSELAVKIKEAQSIQYDLKNQLYTVFFLSKPSYSVRFELSEKDKSEIISWYYKLKLNEISENVLLEDKCAIMPKLYTILSIKNNNKYFDVKIDANCDKPESKNTSLALRIKKYLQILKNILKDKPEIKSAPASDIWYI